MAKILIIEDDQQTQELYTKALEKEGHQVQIQKNAKFNASLYRDFNPDLILLDVMLPGKKNGFDILEEIMKDIVLKRVPVIMLTSIDSEKSTALEIGAKEYLVKSSTSIEDLLKVVKNYI